MKLNPYWLPRPCSASFSGGRSSAYMLRKILDAFCGCLPDDIKILFANTGKERLETLEFVRDVQSRWRVPITWVEYSRNLKAPLVSPRNSKHIGCHGYKVVTFETASRHGEPFEQLINVKAEFRDLVKNEPPVLPNPAQRWCTADLKERTMERHLFDCGWEEFYVAIGFRGDEPERAKRLDVQKKNHILDFVFPMCQAGTTEQDVMSFWKDQRGSLELETWLSMNHAERATHGWDLTLRQSEGNCDLCFMKSLPKQVEILRRRPEIAQWWLQQEKRTGQTFRAGRPIGRIMSLALAAGEVPTYAGDDLLAGSCFCSN